MVGWQGRDTEAQRVQLEHRAEAPAARGRVRIGGLDLDRVGLAEVLEMARASIQQRRPCHIVTVNLQFLSVAERDPAFAQVVNGADVVVADGVPVLWLSRLLGAPIPQRVTGHDLLYGCAALAAQEGYSLFFLGAEPEVAEAATRRLDALFPGLRVAGTHQGAFTPDGYGATEAEERGAVEAVRDARPDILFVALGCPKQEYWASRHLHEVEVPVCAGIGGVLDVLAGRRQRAPTWMQRAGLEWLFRLQQEPRRLLGRYLGDGVPTSLRLGAAALWTRASPAGRRQLQAGGGA